MPLPVPDIVDKCSASFLFKPPQEVHFVGGYPLKSATLTKDEQSTKLVQIDLALVLPQMVWQRKDSTNYVYHVKRAYYLALLAGFFKRSSKFKELIKSYQFKYFNDNFLRPVLELVPNHKLSRFVRINLLLVPSREKTFVYHRFALDRCNIRANDNQVESKDEEDDGAESTPLYNSFILEDLTLVPTSRSLVKLVEGKSNLESLLKLIRLWLDRIQLRRQFAHVLTVFICSLVKKREINTNLAPFQLFVHVLNKIVSADWMRNGVIVNVHDEDVEASDPLVKVNLDDYKEIFDVSVVDESSGLNLAYSVTVDQYERLREDAARLRNILTGSGSSMLVDNLQEHFDCSQPLEDCFYFDFFIR